MCLAAADFLSVFFTTLHLMNECFLYKRSQQISKAALCSHVHLGPDVSDSRDATTGLVLIRNNLPSTAVKEMIGNQLTVQTVEDSHHGVTGLSGPNTSHQTCMSHESHMDVHTCHSLSTCSINEGQSGDSSHQVEGEDPTGEDDPLIG